MMLGHRKPIPDRVAWRGVAVGIAPKCAQQVAFEGFVAVSQAHQAGRQVVGGVAQPAVHFRRSKATNRFLPCSSIQLVTQVVPTTDPYFFHTPPLTHKTYAVALTICL